MAATARAPKTSAPKPTDAKSEPAPRPSRPLDDSEDSHLPIERVSMPSEDVSDLHDVVDAINKLCDTMKTSYDNREDRCNVREVDPELVEPTEVVIEKVETFIAENWTERIEDVESVTSESEHYSEETSVETIRAHAIEDLKTISSYPIEEIETVVSHFELVTAEPMQYEPTSEMYFTASSEVSLMSDLDVQERLGLCDDSDNRRDDRNSVMAGHVAAMREHFESMTRTNTPCPDLLRSSSPSFEVFRTVTNSPDN